MSSAFTMDIVEQHLTQASDAKAFCLKFHPAFLQWLEQEIAWVNAGHAIDTELDQAFYDAMVLAYARMSLRNGSQSDFARAYHNEGHILEILKRLHDLKEKHPNSCQASRWRLLALFAATHDLRQAETGQCEGPAGANEQASAEEASRLLHICQITESSFPQSLQTLQDMILGSTFFMRKAHSTGPCIGALAPDWVNIQNLDGEAAQLVLLASDLDTANVADSFVDYIRSSLALCQERLQVQAIENEAERVSFTRDFLERVQWDYFHECQRFHSQEAQFAFSAQKQANEALLASLTSRLKNERAFESAKAICYWYMQTAEHIQNHAESTLA